jgi:hypothetical protein
MRVEMFTLCDFAQECGGKLTVVGTFDTLIARNFPCIHPQLSVVIRIRFDLLEFKTHTFKIEACGLNDELSMEPVSGQLQVNSVGNATAVSHLVFTIGNLKFRSHGIVNFVLFVDGKEITSTPLYIRKIEPPPS